MLLTLDEQLKMMKRLVPEWAIQTDSRVAHGKPWVPHEYVTHMLDTVFGPDGWSFEVGTIKPIALPNNDQLIYVPGKMKVKFRRWFADHAIRCGHWPGAGQNRFARSE